MENPRRRGAFIDAQGYSLNDDTIKALASVALLRN
jgi:hypothetical protein